jgi:foldase protein PrsA
LIYKKVLTFSVLFLFTLSLVQAFDRGLKVTSVSKKNRTDWVARVNDVTISYDLFQRAYLVGKSALTPEEHSKENLNAIKQTIIDELVENNLLSQGASYLSIKIDETLVDGELSKLQATFPDRDSFLLALEDENIFLNELRDGILYQLLVSSISDRLFNDEVVVTDDLEQFYLENINQFQSTYKIEASLIIVDNDDKANDIVRLIQAGSDFNELAVSASIHSSHASSGDIVLSDLNPENEIYKEYLESLGVGDISSVIKFDEKQFIILRLNSFDKNPDYKFEDIRDEVWVYLKKTRSEQLFVAWFDDFKNSSKIEINRRVFGKKTLPDQPKSYDIETDWLL